MNEPETSENRPLLSVVCPVFNEENGIREFYTRTSAVLKEIAPSDHEIVFVNDGSSDGSDLQLEKLVNEDTSVRVISLSRNFGHQAAITAGIDKSKGQAVVVIDSDLQDPPEVIKEMLEKWREGFKVVYGVRNHRKGESRVKLLTAKVFYRLLSLLSDTPLPVDSGDFRLMDRKVVEALGEIREDSRYIRGLVSWVGFSQCPVYYNRDSRFAGETKYTMRKMIRFATDGITSFSERPLRLATQLGLLTMFASLGGAFYFLMAKIFDFGHSVEGYTSTILLLLFLSGIQLFCIGMLGTYLGRTYRQTKARPLYIVDEDSDKK